MGDHRAGVAVQRQLATWRFALLATVLMAVAAAAAAPRVLAHGGHDHGPSIEVSASVAPRFEASSDDFELLAVLKGADLMVTLDRFRTNEPVTDARIEATVDGAAALVTDNRDGTYKIASPRFGKPGRVEVLFTIQAGTISDLLAGAIEVPGAAVAPLRAVTWWTRWTGRAPLSNDAILAALAGLLAGVLGTLLLRRPNRSTGQAADGAAGNSTTPAHNVVTTADAPPAATTNSKHKRKQGRGAAASALLIVGAAAAGLTGSANPTRAEAPTKTITITADLPQRLPDGSLFVPKVTQRLLSIRTVLAGESTAGSTIELNGQIIADPRGFGRVQATVDGRIDVPPGGLVVSGQRVDAGQALAILTPVVATADRSAFESTAGEIDTRIALAEAKLARLTRIAGLVAQKDIDDTRTELETLKTRRAAVRSAVREKTTLTAPIAGIVSMSAAVPGQLATARETLFEIVDPAKLWVEAIAFDARLVAEITAARAIEATGEVLVLDYVGRGVSARQQGVPLHFAIKAPPATLVIGKPVTVLITTKETRQGLILPQSAVVKGQNGLPIVWTHTQAERFKPNIVKVRAIDGQRLLVEGGLAPNERVVVDGATLLNQVR